MATVETIVKESIASWNSEVAYLLAVKWLNDRYQELVSRVRFNHLRRIGELRTAAVIDTGTITATRGSTAIVGVATTWAAAPAVFATTVQPYWAFKASVAWQEVDAVVGNLSLTLSTEFSETTQAAGSSYKLVKRYHMLDSNARWLGHFVHPRLGVNLGEPVTQKELDSIDPRRTLIGALPQYVSPVGTTKTGNTDGVGNLMVELYPYATEAELIKYVYWDIPSEFGITDTLPPQIDAYILKDGIYINYCKYMMAKREREGKLEATAFWRNEMHAATTKWEAKINQATRADRAVDDLSFILERDSGSSHHGFGDIRTARGHWLSGYTRP
jgi:hypothetical protein